MSSIEKRIKKFYSKPIPNDITFDDVVALANYFGCEVRHGGNHSQQIICKAKGKVIPIPMHGKCVGEAYIKELKELFDSIKEI